MGDLCGSHAPCTTQRPPIGIRQGLFSWFSRLRTRFGAFGAWERGPERGYGAVDRRELKLFRHGRQKQRGPRTPPASRPCQLPHSTKLRFLHKLLGLRVPSLPPYITSHTPHQPLYHTPNTVTMVSAKEVLNRKEGVRWPRSVGDSPPLTRSGHRR
jgi:hypothetical protein